MRRSRLFMPTLREAPAEAQIVSHRLMLRTGMIRQSSAGIYSWLPLGLRVLRRIEGIVRAEQDAAGGQEVLMPTIQPATLWRQSGRYDDYGQEMLRIRDRHGRDMLYGPTNEEAVAEIAAHGLHSYRDLPKNLYHIQWKFRDEVRPRFGVMRGREFLMKDAYSLDVDVAGARRSYNRMFVAYLRTFDRMGLRAIPVRADSGPIGGDMSHEFMILAKTGESGVFCDRALLDMQPPRGRFDYDGDLAALVAAWTAPYAAAGEAHDPAGCGVPAERLVSARGIEVGHIFFFGDKYATPLGATVQSPGGDRVPLQMGSYGIGISRLAGAIIEACHDDRGIVWPAAVAPCRVGIVNLKSGDAACDGLCEALYRDLGDRGLDCLLDDRDERAGVKFAEMDMIGLPWQLVVGPRGLAAGHAELVDRATGEKRRLPVDGLGDAVAAAVA